MQPIFRGKKKSSFCVAYKKHAMVYWSFEKRKEMLKMMKHQAVDGIKMFCFKKRQKDNVRGWEVISNFYYEECGPISIGFCKKKKEALELATKYFIQISDKYMK